MSNFVVTSGKITLTASATKTAILLNPVTNNCTIFGIDISLDGSAAAQSVQFDLYRATTLGTPAGTTGVQTNTDDTDAVAATTTSLTALTTEPTTATVVKSWMVTPFGGLFPYQLPLGREYKLKGGGTRWGIRWTTASGVTPDLVVNIDFAE